ncbi:DNA pilot protein [Sigmofec virus UA08Rod_5614]|uniref:DNA pilot protein n=1 Tax=Sigmofec virus UA08Rod_5614 TaxID=2929431 RepID=A0A976N122_9VIRU|nr:DNA pilot protein [Sigmofec virus UA08Rod_5614]
MVILLRRLHQVINTGNKAADFALDTLLFPISATYDMGKSIFSTPSLDNSSGSMPVGDTYRGVGSSFFNANNVAREDWLRNKQLMDLANSFSASEAQKNRDFQERMSNTSYQRAIDDMKKAGINPVLAFNQGGSSTPTGGFSTSVASSSGSSGRYNADGALLGGLLKLLSGFVQIGSAVAPIGF